MSAAHTLVDQPAPTQPEIARVTNLGLAPSPDRFFTMAALGVCTLALVVRVAAAARAQGLWLDESTGIAAALEPRLPQAVLTAVLHDARPPLYHATLWLWFHLFASVDGARWLSIGAGLAAVALSISLAWSLWGRWPALVTGVLGALSPWHIYYSAEIRMYALESALGVLTLWALWRSTKRGRRADWALYVVSAVAFAWTDLFAILALLGQAAWLFWNSRSMTAAQWRKVKFAWATILVSTLPLALVGAGALTRGSGTGVHSGLLRGLTLLADVGAGFIATAPAQIAAVCGVTILSLLTVILMRHDPRLSFVASYFFTPIGLVFAAGLIIPVWVERTLLFVTPGFWLLVGGLVFIGMRLPTRARFAIVSAAALVCVIEASALMVQNSDRYLSARHLPTLTAYQFAASHAGERFLNIENFTAAPFQVLDAMNHRPTSQWELASHRNPGMDAVRQSPLLKPFSSFLIQTSKGLAWDPGSRRVSYADIASWCNQGSGFWLSYLQDPEMTIQSPLARLDVRLTTRHATPRTSSGIEPLLPADFHPDQRLAIDGTIFVHYQKSI